jgi:hypothetical protein
LFRGKGFRWLGVRKGRGSRRIVLSVALVFSLGFRALALLR